MDETININTLIAGGFVPPQQLDRLKECAAFAERFTEEEAKTICHNNAIAMVTAVRDLMQSWLDGNATEFNWMPTQQQLEMIMKLVNIASFQFSADGTNFTGALYNFKDDLILPGE
jgi:hypothetical protein